jgi:hypothetical protein
MKVKKAIKCIAALGVGASMLGMTMGGAMAADLSQYPSMFIKDGQFNGVIVIGKNADAIDTLGMTNIAFGLQAAAVTKTTVCSSGSSSTPTVSEGVKIDQSSTHMNVGVDIENIKPTLDDGDLPEIFAKVQYTESKETKNDVEEVQSMEFTDGTDVFGYYQDDDGAEVAGPYVKFNDADPAYTYKLEFDSSVEFDAASTTSVANDFQSTVITLQGKKYTITGVGSTGAADNKVLTKLTLMAGDTTSWMTQGQTITKTVNGVEHSIKMTDVTEGADSCGFTVDGTSIWIDVDATETVAGMTIGVVDAKAVHTELQDGDICKVNFGASELVLEDGQEVQVEGDDVQGSLVTFNGDVGTWDGFDIEWTPDDVTYLASGKELVDPVFGNFKFVFAGVSRSDEDVKVSTSTNSGSIVFLNTAGKEIKLPLYKSDNDNDAGTYCVFGTGIATDEDKQLYLGNAVCTGDDDATDCEGATWLINKGNEAHIIKVKNIDMDASGDWDGKISFEDMTTGTSTLDKGYDDGIATGIAMSGIGTVQVTVDEGAKTVEIDTPAVLTSIRTKGAAQISLIEAGDSAGDGCNVTFREDKNAGATAAFTVLYDATDEELQIQAPVVSNQFDLSPLDASSDDSDNQVYVTNTWGTLVNYNSDTKKTAVMKYPASKTAASLYVAPTGAALSSSAATAAGCQVYETVNKIPSSVNKFDSDVTAPTAQNIISVGGPCANAVTSALLGNPSVCYQGFESGKAMLKLVETGDKVALVVAGGTGEDTWRASKILQNYDKYTLTGKQMVATTVSETGLAVSPVQ